jgi:hypothetical protein
VSCSNSSTGSSERKRPLYETMNHSREDRKRKDLDVGTQACSSFFLAVGLVHGYAA